MTENNDLRTTIEKTFAGANTLGVGELAQLRRMSPERITGAAFWRLQALYFDHLLPGASAPRVEVETRWATALVGWAHLYGLVAAEPRLGKALAEGGYSDHRFVRLMRADDGLLGHEVLSAARFLAAKKQMVNWVDAALLLLVGEQKRELLRRNISRDYYQAQEKDKS